MIEHDLTVSDTIHTRLTGNNIPYKLSLYVELELCIDDNTTEVDDVETFYGNVITIIHYYSLSFTAMTVTADYFDLLTTTT